jgi:hypothetical protein
MRDSWTTGGQVHGLLPSAGWQMRLVESDLGECRPRSGRITELLGAKGQVLR